jgi:SynChlorMet cassette protein ScmC
VYPPNENHENYGYFLVLGNGFSWRLTGDPDTLDWLESFAAILNLQSGNGSYCSRIHFVSRRSRWGWARNPKTFLGGIPGGYSSSSDWRCRSFPRLRLWYQTDSPDVICELTLPKRRADSILLMYYAIQGLYYGLAIRGGFPLHSALVEKDGIGILLAGNEGIGKSTCCRRLPDSWNVIADDSVVIAPGPGATYCAHPFPTWSELINCGQNVAWDVQRPVRLGAAMFLGRGDEIEITPLGQGRAAVLMTASASYVCNVGRQAPNRSAQIELRRRLFLNACAPAAFVRCFSLKLSPDGAFWEKIQEAIGDVKKH